MNNSFVSADDSKVLPGGGEESGCVRHREDVSVCFRLCAVIGRKRILFWLKKLHGIVISSIFSLKVKSHDTRRKRLYVFFQTTVHAIFAGPATGFCLEAADTVGDVTSYPENETGGGRLAEGGAQTESIDGLLFL